MDAELKSWLEEQHEKLRKEVTNGHSKPPNGVNKFKDWVMFGLAIGSVLFGIMSYLFVTKLEHVKDINTVNSKIQQLESRDADIRRNP